MRGAANNRPGKGEVATGFLQVQHLLLRVVSQTYYILQPCASPSSTGLSIQDVTRLLPGANAARDGPV
jgi:hypothetical protein